MNFNVIYEDGSLLVIDKPAGIVVFPEGRTHEKTLIDYLIEKDSLLENVGERPRYGVVHRLDKDTSGILLVAKKEEALTFLQKQFSAVAKALADKKNRATLEKTLEKRYIALATGDIKSDTGIIHTLIGRSPADPRKQKAYSLDEKAPESAREALTEYKVLKRFQDYTLLEIQIHTGRKHQIRCQMAYIHHPLAGDKVYGFKDSPTPDGLTRQFLHAEYLKIKLPNGITKEFKSELPQQLKQILEII